MDNDFLVGLTEIAMRAGVQKPAVSTWRTRYEDFPEPFQTLHTGSVWWWSQVKPWLIRTGRQTDAGWTLEQITPLTHRQNRKRQTEFNEHKATRTRALHDQQTGTHVPVAGGGSSSELPPGSGSGG